MFTLISHANGLIEVLSFSDYGQKKIEYLRARERSDWLFQQRTSKTLFNPQRRLKKARYKQHDSERCPLLRVPPALLRLPKKEALQGKMTSCRAINTKMIRTGFCSCLPHGSPSSTPGCLGCLVSSHLSILKCKILMFFFIPKRGLFTPNEAEI